jgi:hypothetical protein
MSKTMSPSDLKALLAAEKADALAAASAAKLSADRADAMDYYLGDMAKHMPAGTAARPRSPPTSPTPSKG